MSIMLVFYIAIAVIVVLAFLSFRKSSNEARTEFTPLLNAYCGRTTDGKTWTERVDSLTITYSPMKWGDTWSLWVEAPKQAASDRFEIDLDPNLSLAATRKRATTDNYHPEGWPAGIILDDFNDYDDNDWTEEMRLLIPQVDPSYLVALMKRGVTKVEADYRDIRWKVDGSSARAVVKELPEVNRLMTGWLGEINRLRAEAA